MGKVFSRSKSKQNTYIALFIQDNWVFDSGKCYLLIFIIYSRMWYKGKIWSHGFRGCNFVSCIQHVFFPHLSCNVCQEFKVSPLKPYMQLNLSHFTFRPRFWRWKVHLIWGSPVASAMFHLLPVLCFTGGCRLFPWRWQDLMPWLQQQPIKKPLTHPFPWLFFRPSQHFKNPQSLPRKVTQAKKMLSLRLFLWWEIRSDFLTEETVVHRILLLILMLIMINGVP